MPNYDWILPDPADSGSADPPGQPAQTTPTNPGAFGPTPGTGYQPPPYTGDVAAWLRQVRTDLGLVASQDNHQALQTIVSLAQKAGAPIQMDAVDSNGHLGGLIINGQKEQLINGNDQWTDPTPWSTASTQGAPIPVDPSYLAPFDRPYVAPADAKQPDPFTYPDFVAPDAFQAPTADSILQDPSYAFREGRLRGSIENSAAAKGVLNSSGTIDQLLTGVGDFASQEYGNIWNRDFNLWNTNYQDALTNYGTNRTNQSNIYDLATQRAGTAQANAWQQYVEDKDTYYKNQTNPFTKLLQTSQLGFQAAVN